MIFRTLRFGQKSGKTGISNARFLQKSTLLVGLSLLALTVTFCGLNPSGFERTEPSSDAPVSLPLATDTPVPTPTITSTPENSVPVLAYYYIWFDVESWSRAKTDYPLLGRYSSDDAAVMRQHIRWAKEAGITGFIVSWKGTDKLNRRLDQLVKIAEQEDFKLAIIYESLDFERNPLPVQQVNADLRYFVARYAGHQVFDLFGKPVVIWAGIWEFTLDEIQSVAQDKRGYVFVLASEKNVKGYQRLANLVDGDAYYWSSVDPEVHPGYQEKLKAMGDAVHENGGLWIAPAAPGFDSRLLGDATVIHRRNGDTLQTEMDAALQSDPDAIGLISWNEFSENTHIEPSKNHGKQYLEVLAKIDRITVPDSK